MHGQKPNRRFHFSALGAKLSMKPRALLRVILLYHRLAHPPNLFRNVIVTKQITFFPNLKLLN